MAPLGGMLVAVALLAMAHEAVGGTHLDTKIDKGQTAPHKDRPGSGGSGTHGSPTPHQGHSSEAEEAGHRPHKHGKGGGHGKKDGGEREGAGIGPGGMPAPHKGREGGKGGADEGAGGGVGEGGAPPEQKIKLPIKFVHIPKAGTSFVNTLIHYVNPELPPEASFPMPRMCYDEKSSSPATRPCRKGEKPMGGIHHPKVFLFEKLWPYEKWFKGAFWLQKGNKMPPMGGTLGHAPLEDDVYEAYKGRIFGIFRNPRDRIFSAYKFFCVQMRRTGGVCKGGAVPFSRTAAGTSVRMLAGLVRPLRSS